MYGVADVDGVLLREMSGKGLIVKIGNGCVARLEK